MKEFKRYNYQSANMTVFNPRLMDAPELSQEGNNAEFVVVHDWSIAAVDEIY